MNIYPSILEHTVDEFTRQLKNVAPYFSHFQIDITDGLFVPDKTVQPHEMEGVDFSSLLQETEISHFVRDDKNIDMDDKDTIRDDKEIDRVDKGNDQHNKPKTVEFHLMVRDYQSYIHQIEKLNSKLAINRIFIPANQSKRSVVFHEKYEIGLVLNPQDTIEEYLKLVSQYKSVLLMTVNPGAQGNPFKPEVLDKIDMLRMGGYEGEIVLDGGINDVTLNEIVSRKYVPAGVCPGSYFKENVKERLALLQSIVISNST